MQYRLLTKARRDYIIVHLDWLFFIKKVKFLFKEKLKHQKTFQYILKSCDILKQYKTANFLSQHNNCTSKCTASYRRPDKRKSFVKVQLLCFQEDKTVYTYIMLKDIKAFVCKQTK